MKIRNALLALSFAAIPTGSPFAQTNTFKSGETVDLHSVYWVSNCISRLEGFYGVDMISGPTGVTLSLRRENVMAVRQQCRDPVPGAMVVAKMPIVTQPVSGTLSYQVTYMTKDGKQTSQHSRNITIAP